MRSISRHKIDIYDFLGPKDLLYTSNILSINNQSCEDLDYDQQTLEGSGQKANEP